MRLADGDVVSVILGLFVRSMGFLWLNRGCRMQGADGLAGGQGPSEQGRGLG